jgi:ABC-2 type transport system permease protein
MHKMLMVALRDYKAAVRSKSFLASLLMMPVLMFGGAGVQVLIERSPDTQDKLFAIIDRTPHSALVPLLQKAVEKRNNDARNLDPVTHERLRPRFVLVPITPSENDPEAIERQRLELADLVRKEKYWGFVEIGSKVEDNVQTPDLTEMAKQSVGNLIGIPLGSKESQARPDEAGQYDDSHSLRYHTNHPTFEEFPSWIQGVLIYAIMAHKSGATVIDSEQKQPWILKREGLPERDLVTGKVVDQPLGNQIAQFLVPAVLVFLMFMMIMISSTPAMHGVVEEKMQRIAEVLLGSVTPFQLMLGKLIGVLAVSLTMAAVYLGGIYVVALYKDWTRYLPAHVLLWFLLFLLLAVTMYGSIFLAIGSAASDVKETQTLVLPVILLACIPMFVLRNALENPNHPLVVWTSFLPPVTPMLMTVRIAISPGPVWWQPLLSVTLAIATTIACVYAAGRIFRVGILMQGKGARLGQIVSWVFRG